MKLAGKNVVVTGAASGIGLAVARGLAEAGARVTLGDRDEPALRAAAAELRAAGLAVAEVVCDVTKPAQVDELIAAAAPDGRLHALVNNAAIALGGDLDQLSEADWARVIDTNLGSVFRCTKAALPRLLAAGSASVVNIGSVQGHRSWSGWPAYAAAKGGVSALTRQLAGQYGARGLRFNCVSPGAIATPMNERRVAEEGEKLLAAWTGMSAIPRLGLPAEIAALVVFLASDEAGFITGQDILADGGLSVLPRYRE